MSSILLGAYEIRQITGRGRSRVVARCDCGRGAWTNHTLTCSITKHYEASRLAAERRTARDLCVDAAARALYERSQKSWADLTAEERAPWEKEATELMAKRVTGKDGSDG